MSACSNASDPGSFSKRAACGCLLLRFKPFLPIFWGLKEIRAQLRGGADDPLWNVFEMEQFVNLAFALRGHCSQIVNLLKQPVHGPVLHGPTSKVVPCGTARPQVKAIAEMCKQAERFRAFHRFPPTK